MKCPNCLVDGKAHAGLLDALKQIADISSDKAARERARAAIKAATS